MRPLLFFRGNYSASDEDSVGDVAERNNLSRAPSMRKYSSRESALIKKYSAPDVNLMTSWPMAMYAEPQAYLPCNNLNCKRLKFYSSSDYD